MHTLILILFLAVSASAGIISKECAPTGFNAAGDEIASVNCTVYTDDVGVFTIHLEPSDARMRVNADGTLRTGDRSSLASAIDAKASAEYAVLSGGASGRRSAEEKLRRARGSVGDIIQGL